ncbi:MULTISPECIES: HTH domain-containing protein [Methylomicrobium]|uniref:Putative transcriptional regulator n=1 Tax=Methylomicrobium album BG8 TaxID=686340 RepID=H8GKY8_METAL|nr:MULTISPECIES: HTH domain-containing protein [Methylomicrobium]EIC30469.1 putative transcriptional regulator [Methylomicrobium album BG8]
MDRFDRIFKLHNLFASRRTPISMKALKQELQCSRATVARALEEMEDYLGAPVEYDKKRNGYFYNRRDGEHPYELPGLWFSADELHGLLICQHLLTRKYGADVEVKEPDFLVEAVMRQVEKMREIYPRT